jgi:hypothetical protein
MDDALAIMSSRATSKKIYNVITDDFVFKLIYLSKDKDKNRTKNIYAAIKSLIRKEDTQTLKFLLKIMAKFNRRKASETVKQFLPYTAQYSSLKFLKEYMSIRINGWKPSFKPLNVLKIVEFLHRSEKFDVLDFLLPNLVKLFEGSNESHLEFLQGKFRDEKNINLGPEGILPLISKLSAKMTLNLNDLMTLSEPKKPKLVIPDGNLIKIFRHTWNEYDYYGFWCESRGSENYDIYYYDRKRTKHVITITKRDEEFQYEDFKTKNLYELIVRTNIFNQIYSTFPYQHVALTVESFNLPLDQQPWFFGALTKSEIDALCKRGPGEQQFFTASEGSQILRYKTLSIHHPDRMWSGSTAVRTQIIDFQTGLYNGGAPRHHDIYKLFLLLSTEDQQNIYDNAIKFIRNNNIDLKHPRLSEPVHLLQEYIKNRGYQLNEDLIRWLVNNGLPVNTTNKILEHSLGHISDNLLQFLLDKGAKTNLQTFLNSITNMVQFHKLLRCYKAYDDNKILLLSAVLKKFANYAPKEFCSPKILPMLAWRFGNEDNYFKLLPKEIVLLICSYGLDRPAWWILAEQILIDSAENEFHPPIEIFWLDQLSDTVISPVLSFVVTYHDRFSELSMNIFIKYLFDAAPRILVQAEKLIFDSPLSKKIRKNPPDEKKVTALFKECLEKPTALPLLKRLVKENILRKEFFMEPRPKEENWRIIAIPPAWLAIASRNYNTIDYLFVEGFMPLRFKTRSLESYAQLYSCQIQRYLS